MIFRCGAPVRRSPRGTDLRSCQSSPRSVTSRPRCSPRTLTRWRRSSRSPWSVSSTRSWFATRSFAWKERPATPCRCSLAATWNSGAWRRPSRTSCSARCCQKSSTTDDCRSSTSSRRRRDRNHLLAPGELRQTPNANKNNSRPNN